jgi:hypothetical protein
VPSIEGSQNRGANVFYVYEVRLIQYAYARVQSDHRALVTRVSLSRRKNVKKAIASIRHGCAIAITTLAIIGVASRTRMDNYRLVVLPRTRHCFTYAGHYSDQLLHV